MLWAAYQTGLELRTEGGETRLSGRFPYGSETVLREAGDGGPELREVFAPGAFKARDVQQKRNVHLLAAHDFAKPIASVLAGTLTLTDTADALVIEARIDPLLANVSYMMDLLAGIRAGLTIGISPGFRVATELPGAEVIQRKGNAVLRTITVAHLQEISIVTRPAYPEAQIEARCWLPGAETPAMTFRPQITRWR